MSLFLRYWGLGRCFPPCVGGIDSPLADLSVLHAALSQYPLTVWIRIFGSTIFVQRSNERQVLVLPAMLDSEYETMGEM